MVKNPTKYYIWSDAVMDYIEVTKEVYDAFIAILEKTNKI